MYVACNICNIFSINIINKCYANRSWNLINEDATKSKVQELCNLNSWIIEKTLYQKKNIYFILILILYWIECRSECIKISELKQDEDELILKSQEVQRQTHANILNIEQSAKNFEFNKRNQNFSLQEIMRSRNWAFSKNSNRICKKRNLWNDQFTLQRIRKNYQKDEKHSDVHQYIANSKKIAEIETEMRMTVIFTHEFVKYSKATSVSDKIITTKAKLIAISDAITICSEKALKNSEIWVYMNSQMTLQRLNIKSNINVKLFDDIRQDLINLRQNQC